MKSRILIVLAALMLAPVMLFAQRATTIQLGSILPANSIYDRALKQMAADWQRETEGRVRLRVQSGTVKDEATLARRLSVGRPQAAVFVQPGELDDAFNVFGIPFFFESDEEAFHVVEKLTPTFERVLAEEGLVLLNWGHGGWTRFFTANRVETLDDLKETKLFTTAGDQKMQQWYKRNGFDPTPLAITDVLLGLNTGLINAYPSPPYGALLLGWYDKAPYMLDVPLTPLLGITVVAERSWNRISAEDQRTLRAAAKRFEQTLRREVPMEERESIDQMKERGLTVVALDEAAIASFRAVADELTASWRGTIIPADIYDVALRERDAFRATR
jgi:TRAP-type C4-dicarboxylate transport system substrate-binding protein